LPLYATGTSIATRYQYDCFTRSFGIISGRLFSPYSGSDTPCCLQRRQHCARNRGRIPSRRIEASALKLRAPPAHLAAYCSCQPASSATFAAAAGAASAAAAAAKMNRYHHQTNEPKRTVFQGISSRFLSAICGGVRRTHGYSRNPPPPSRTALGIRYSEMDTRDRPASCFISAHCLRMVNRRPWPCGSRVRRLSGRGQQHIWQVLPLCPPATATRPTRAPRRLPAIRFSSVLNSYPTGDGSMARASPPRRQSGQRRFRPG